MLSGKHFSYYLNSKILSSIYLCYSLYRREATQLLLLLLTKLATLNGVNKTLWDSASQKWLGNDQHVEEQLSSSCILMWTGNDGKNSKRRERGSVRYLKLQRNRAHRSELFRTTNSTDRISGLLTFTFATRVITRHAVRPECWWVSRFELAKISFGIGNSAWRFVARASPSQRKDTLYSTDERRI